MAVNEDDDRTRPLTWPPSDEDALEVFHVETPRNNWRSGDPAEGSPRAGLKVSAPAKSGTPERPPALSAAAVGPSPGSSSAGGATRDEPPHVHRRSAPHWRLAFATRLATLFGARPQRPAWMTTGRLAIALLALVAIGEGAFIGVRMARSAGTVNMPKATATAARSDGLGLSASGARLEPKAQGREPGPPSEAVGTSGRLVVQTSPAGGAVAIDGRSVGTAPVSVADLENGDHTVVVRSRRGSLTERVHVAAGQETNVLVPLSAAVAPEAKAPARPAATSGYLAVKAPMEMHIFEGDALVGTSQMAQIALPPGRHTLLFVNDAVGYRRTQNIAITSGKTSEVALDLPKQSVAINALPWADVWIDGQHVGETPIGRATVTIGPHTVVFRNPDLGERTVKTLVTAAEPSRISVDLRK